MKSGVSNVLKILCICEFYLKLRRIIIVVKDCSNKYISG